MELPLKIAICEDLAEDRDKLLDILNKSNFACEMSVFTCGEDFLAGYQLRSYDLIFFDIYMDGMTGIEAATELRKIDADVTIVFTTTSLEYALESYRLEALKYIEKPVTARSIIPILQSTYQQKKFAPTLIMRTKPQETQVVLTDILYLEQNGAKYQVRLIDGQVITAPGKLSAIMEQLDERSFYHCHKSFIVNFSFVKRINKELLMFEMVQGAAVHIRRDGFWKTKRAYEAFLFGSMTSEDSHV